MAALVSAITNPPPQRNSPPGLGRELGSVFPALVRARNDCFVALDLDPGNLGLALDASFTTIALEKAHGHSPFCQPFRDSAVAEWLAGLWVDVPARYWGLLCTFKRCKLRKSDEWAELILRIA